MLDVRRMQVLRAVITSGSVTAAAGHLGYTPSAVSQQVAALEKQAGTALLERVGRGVRPTAAGRLLADHAEIISRDLAAAEAALADLRAGHTGRLAVRYFASAGAALVAPALVALRRTHPRVPIDLRLADPAAPLHEVEQGRADLALAVGPDPRPHEGVRTVHLHDDPYDAILPAHHPLAEREEVDLIDLDGEPWVGSEPPGPCLDAVLTACAAAGFSPGFAVESEDYATAQGFVAAGLGVALMPRLALGSTPAGVVVRPVRNPRPLRRIHVAVREVSLARPAVRDLLDALREAVG
ncbi:LysR family transcriptional regulator [Streptomyces sp. NPDC057939]|uniref:LysR family transcriptional regulator n=1 Tax=Streptomyces sp. NPDC057939 TaxID=3346284 RepID=UPI0036E01D1E